MLKNIMSRDAFSLQRGFAMGRPRVRTLRAPTPRPPRTRMMALNRPPKEKESMLWNQTLLQGDMIMLVCTALSSDTVPIQEIGPMVACMTFCWFVAATLRGDYTRAGEPTEGLADLELKQGYGLYQGILRGTVTWLPYCVLTTAVWSVIYSTYTMQMPDFIDYGYLDTASRVPPFVELIVAQSLTMACWRGIASMFFQPQDPDTRGKGKK